MKKLKKLLAAALAAALFCCSAVFPADAGKSGKPEISYEISYGKNCVYLALSPSGENSVIRYTTDGSAPTGASKKYTSRLCAKKAMEVRAAEYDENGEKLCSIRVNLKLRCETVEITAKPKDGKYLVSLSSDTKDCLIYYTTDGSKPDRNSSLYDKPFLVKKDTQVRAYAVKTDYTKSIYSSEKINDKTPGSVMELRYGATAARILELINKRRKENGLSPLVMDDQLFEGAKIRGKEISAFYGHKRPDGTDWSTILDEVGFPAAMAAENIAWSERTLSTPEITVEAWMNSPSHRASILTPEYDLTGIFSVCCGETTYWVQLFGKKQ